MKAFFTKINRVVPLTASSPVHHADAAAARRRCRARVSRRIPSSFGLRSASRARPPGPSRRRRGRARPRGHARPSRPLLSMWRPLLGVPSAAPNEHTEPPWRRQCRGQRGPSPLRCTSRRSKTRTSSADSLRSCCRLDHHAEHRTVRLIPAR